MLSFFLAKRFFAGGGERDGQTGRASAPTIRIATAGIAVGLAVMLISVCVVKGYQHQVSEKLVGFASHLEVIDINSYSSPESFPTVTDSTLISTVKKTPGAVQVQRFSQKIGILKTENDFAGVMLKGVAQDYDLSFMKKNIVEGKMPGFTDKKSSGDIVISRTLAEKLGLHVGDKVYSYYFARTIKQRRFKVAAIYDTHLRQFDRTFILTDLFTVNQLNDWDADQSSGLEVRLTSFDQLEGAQKWLSQNVTGKRDRLGHTRSVVSIKENQRTASVLSWLELLDFNVMVILIIMVCVAGFTMISGLLILILERTRTIGVLKALGATNTRIRHTFLWFAGFIVGRGLIIGNAIGLALVALQQHFQLVPLDPEKYYVDSVPVEFDWLWIAGVNGASLLVTMLALVLPSFLVSLVQPAKSIQFD